ncbi:MAG: hypothetical protein WCW36_01795 [Candidatus Paceibacterota bacterium]
MIETRIEEEGLQHLEHIEQELEEIKDRSTPTHSGSFINGVWQGAGALVGSIIALALLGWVLSLFGVIPGLGAIATYMQSIVAAFHK